LEGYRNQVYRGNTVKDHAKFIGKSVSLVRDWTTITAIIGAGALDRRRNWSIVYRGAIRARLRTISVTPIASTVINLE
jgi:hypothetical protein